MQHGVVIASTGRPQVVADILNSLTRQTVWPSEVILAVADLARDVPSQLPAWCRVILAEQGSTTQRNAGIDALSPNIDLVTFFDDDSEPHEQYLAQAQAFALLHPEVVLFSGEVVRDGAVEGSITRADARASLAHRVPGTGVTETDSAYGCNMTARRAVADAVRFDERLPLYGWLDDRDFSNRCARFGRVLAYAGCEVVHLGVSDGRVPGTCLGFSQVVNPHYLWRKGVLSSADAFVLAARTVVGNLFGLLAREDAVDRPSRLKGNLLGLLAILQRKADPRAAALVASGVTGNGALPLNAIPAVSELVEPALANAA